MSLSGMALSHRTLPERSEQRYILIAVHRIQHSPKKKQKSYSQQSTDQRPSASGIMLLSCFYSIRASGVLNVLMQRSVISRQNKSIRYSLFSMAKVIKEE